jgi:hypothetical protein
MIERLDCLTRENHLPLQQPELLFDLSIFHTWSLLSQNAFWVPLRGWRVHMPDSAAIFVPGLNDR